jgi:hypothetical protein
MKECDKYARRVTSVFVRLVTDFIHIFYLFEPTDHCSTQALFSPTVLI